MQPITLNLSSPTINSSRSGPLTGSTDYSDISPHPDLTNPDSTAASLYQRHPQLMAGREDGMCHFSPTGAVQKGQKVLYVKKSSSKNGVCDCGFHLIEYSRIGFYLQLYGSKLLYIIKRVSLLAFSRRETFIYLYQGSPFRHLKHGYQLWPG